MSKKEEKKDINLVFQNTEISVDSIKSFSLSYLDNSVIVMLKDNKKMIFKYENAESAELEHKLNVSTWFRALGVEDDD